MAAKKASGVQVTEAGVELVVGYVNGEEVLYDPTVKHFSTDGHPINPYAPEVTEDELPLEDSE